MFFDHRPYRQRALGEDYARQNKSGWCQTGRVIAFLLLIQLLLAQPGKAIVWKSSYFHCQIDLPEGEPQLMNNRWLPLVPVDPTASETGVAGARKVDRSAVVYLGVVHLTDRPRFVLGPKSIGEVSKQFFGPSIGFQHDVKPVAYRGMNGFRVTGTHRFLGYNYNLVVDMFQANDMVYQVAGLAEDGDPMKDSDVRSFFQSFRILR
jgi:hypothetical protein